MMILKNHQQFKKTKYIPSGFFNVHFPKQKMNLIAIEVKIA